MFKIFERSAAVPKLAANPKAKPAPGRIPTIRCEHTDWALWEDSVSVLDSQMQGLTPSARIYAQDKQTPSELQDLDPFSRVNRKSGKATRCQLA